jgi:glycerophosphoryl diester phosphodiesterase
MKIVLSIILIFLFIFLYSQDEKINPNINKLNPKMIAHAGGGIDNETYTNSYEALNLNYSKGFKYFEIDFSFTKDQKLVCLHDWEKDFINSFKSNLKTPVLLSTFKELNNSYAYTKCELTGLIKWMDKNKDAFIITDVKEDNMKALEIISINAKDKLDGFIPQIYNPKNFDDVQKLGFNKIIWTLYRYNGSNKDILDEIENFNGTVAITMPTYKLENNLLTKLKKQKISIYTHTINNKEEFKKLKEEFFIDNVYTDFLLPQKVEK